ncbi:rhodanese-like domain-containing protein [Psychromonas algicola]|uniref:rhodanese-like domain-containing protein n=1 Tax=Psychromonas algicola TaxID=2555642 RepID=UPI001068470B|nr:rhodanese-like domain-containing protein [Psychromonas sp. RZ5]TEW52756.1 rhodanese-like domain-containing protein [Psychromonas sp. RZ5]
MILDGKGLVDVLRSQVKEVDCTEMNQRLQSDENLLFIDIREAKETALGSAAGSELVPRGILEMQLTSLPKYQALNKALTTPEQLPIYLICRSGARSVLAAASLQQMGYQNVHSVSGGFLAWQSLGFNVTSE